MGMEPNAPMAPAKALLLRNIKQNRAVFLVFMKAYEYAFITDAVLPAAAALKDSSIADLSELAAEAKLFFGGEGAIAKQWTGTEIGARLVAAYGASNYTMDRELNGCNKSIVTGYIKPK